MGTNTVTAVYQTTGNSMVLRYAPFNQSFSTIRNGTTADNDDFNSPNNAIVDIYTAGGSNLWNRLERGIVNYVVPSLGTIQVAKIRLYAQVINNTFASAKYHVQIYTFTPDLDWKSIVAGDYDSFGSTALCATPIEVDAALEDTWWEFTLNTTGLALVQAAQGSTVCFGIRYTEDVNNNPTWENSFKLCNVYFESAGNGVPGINCPQLVLTYSEMVVQTDPATDITGTKATLNGTLVSDSGAPPDTVSFEAGFDATCSDWAGGSQGASGGDTFDAEFDAAAAGALPGDTIYFRAKATDGVDTIYGDVLSFVLGTTGAGSGIILEVALNQSIFTETPAWTDWTSKLMSLDIKRGRQHELDRIEAGEATALVYNGDGRFWPNNSSSAYYPYVKPLTLMRIHGQYNTTTYPLYYGIIESLVPRWISEKGGYAPALEITGIDWFKTFTRYSLIGTSSTGEIFVSELSGNRVDACVNAVWGGSVGWPAGMKNISTGVITVIGLASGGTSSTQSTNNPMALASTGGPNLMDHIYQVTAAEHGNCFTSASGAIIYQGRDYRQTITTSYTLDCTSSTYNYIIPDMSFDDTHIYNSATIKRDNASTAGFEVTLTNVSAASEQGFRSLTSTNTLIANIADAADNVGILSMTYASSSLRCRNVEMYPVASPSTLFPMAFSADLSTKVGFKLNNAQNPANIDQEYFIEGIEHHWEAKTNLWSTKWQLWKTPSIKISKAQHDGYLQNSGSTGEYAVAQAAATASTAYNDVEAVAVGQQDAGVPLAADYIIHRGFIEFDTSNILSTEAISAAKCALFVNSFFNVTNSFDVHIVDPDSVVIPVTASNYGDLLGQTTSYGSITISTSTIFPTWLFVDVNSSGLAAINKATTTRFAFRSSGDINASTPSDSAESWVVFCGVSTSYVPRLYVMVS